MPTWRTTCLAFIPGLLLASEVNFAPIFSDHLVLQRDRPVPLWGTADPGVLVTVTFAGTTSAATADAQGAWRVRLGPFPANATPATLTIAATGTTKTINDVLVGEVWLGSGQSNMAMIARQVMGDLPEAEAVAAARAKNQPPPDVNLRSLLKAAPYPTLRLVTSRGDERTGTTTVAWVPSTTAELTNFSAQFQAFGLHLSQHLKVPVGLMVAAWGGSPSSRWITPESIAADADCQRLLAPMLAKWDPVKAQDTYDRGMVTYERDLEAWKALPVDRQVKGSEPHHPAPPTKPGEGTRWKVGSFHDLVLKPFIGYAIRGVLWDQGESGTMISGIDQTTLMRVLFRSWRQEWGQEDLPFLVVQKPSGGGCGFDPADPVTGWTTDPLAALPTTVPKDGQGRQVYQDLVAFSGTFLVPTMDLGGGIHPANKFAYGRRGAQVALGTVYGQSGEVSGPAYVRHRRDGDGIRVTFAHVGQGLTAARGDHLQGFAVAGEDGKFVWAEATIDGADVVVHSPAVILPVHVRYAWSQAPAWANLFNRDGLPALCFSTTP